MSVHRGCMHYIQQLLAQRLRATYVVKTADETVNNSTALQNDNELFFAMATNTAYFVEVFLRLNASSVNADWKFGWSVPSGCTMVWGPVSSGGSQTVSPWNTEAVTTAPLAFLTQSDTSSLGASASANGHGAYIAAFVRNGSAAGDLQFQWAQNTATGENNTVSKDSWLRATTLR